MSINSVNVGRVSFNLKGLTLLDQLRGNSLRLFREQQRVATGRQYELGSENPLAAGKIVRMKDLLDRQDRILGNLRHADRWFSAAESAASDVSSLLIDAKTLALEQVNTVHSAEERAAAALVIDSTIERLLSLGNQQFDGRYLFGGQRSELPPLENALGRIRFAGDINDRNTWTNIGELQPFNVTVDRLFGLRSRQRVGFVDLNPAATSATRLSDLNGANGRGIRNAAFQVSEVGGAGGTLTIDTTGIDTLGDLVARFNADAAAAGSLLTMSLTSTGLQIDGGPGVQIVVSEIGGGHAASDLGILGSSAVGAPMIGADVDPRVTRTTPLSALNGGAGLSLTSGVQINNGGLSATVSFAGATTVQDVLNRLNNSGVGLRVGLDEAGKRFTILNEVSGFDLAIGENGGTDAEMLGLRTLYGGTPLSELNGGRGVNRVSGDDLRITDANGVVFNVDLSPANTIQDVINLINTAAGAAGSTLTASLRPSGNGLRLSHPTAGTQNILVERANLSAAADDLGIFGTGDTQTLDGADTNPLRAGGVLTALYRLADALRSNDTRAITLAGEELENAMRAATEQTGLLGSRSRAVIERLERTEDAVLATRSFLSQLQDADLTEAVTRFQQAQLALQANLQVGSSLLNLSVLDFLR